jgi:hypothetical protein
VLSGLLAAVAGCDDQNSAPESVRGLKDETPPPAEVKKGPSIKPLEKGVMGPKGKKGLAPQ